MQCVRSKYIIEDSIKKSRFIGILMPCSNETDVVDGLRQLQITYTGASHIAFAYRIKTGNGFISRFNDAGEPSGTAGKPIFQHLEGKELINVLLAVIRYFGGIKLGAGGLTRAYSHSAKRVIESAVLFPYVEFIQMRLILDYNQIHSFEYLLNHLDGEITSQEFAGQVHLTIQLPKQNLKALTDSYSCLDSV